MINDLSQDNQIKKNIYEIAKNIPKLNVSQLKKRYKELTKKRSLSSQKEWLVEAIVRIIQIKEYEKNNIEIPKNIQKNNEKFFKKEIVQIPKDKKQNRKDINKKRNKKLMFVVNFCSSLIENSVIKYHPQKKYATIKKDKSVVVFIEKKLKKIIVNMGGERDKKNSPKINILIDDSKKEIKNKIKNLIKNNIEDYVNRRNKRWENCEKVLGLLIESLKESIEIPTRVHSHPSGRYVTFKSKKNVLIYIYQDRSKGEIYFHPGGEREKNEKLTITIKAKNINNKKELNSIVNNFLKKEFKQYQETKNKIKNKFNENLSRLLNIGLKSLDADEVSKHPKGFFGFIKKNKKTIAMIKKTKNIDFFDVFAWIKKQKNNPVINISIHQSEEEVSKIIKNHISQYLGDIK